MHELPVEKLTKTLIRGIVRDTSFECLPWDGRAFVPGNTQWVSMITRCRWNAQKHLIFGGNKYKGPQYDVPYGCCGVTPVVWRGDPVKFFSSLTTKLSQLGPGFFWFQNVPLELYEQLKQLGARQSSNPAVWFLIREDDDLLKRALEVFISEQATKKMDWVVKFMEDTIMPRLREHLLDKTAHRPFTANYDKNCCREALMSLTNSALEGHTYKEVEGE